MLLVDDEWQLRRWRPLYLQSPQELRGTAARHRQMAEIVSSGDIAVRLRRLAKRYERLANDRERLPAKPDGAAPGGTPVPRRVTSHVSATINHGVKKGPPSRKRRAESRGRHELTIVRAEFVEGQSQMQG
jgi:hypothetical protein